jgi:four helix bundle protein
MGRFEDLKVWQKGVDLAIAVYKLVKETPLHKDFGLKDQMQRSSVSISSNIAEGDELDTQKQSIKFFYIAKGSCAELYTQLIIAENVGYISKDQASKLKIECQEISAMLGKLIYVRKQSIKP